jgi:hypothetical protein
MTLLFNVLIFAGLALQAAVIHALARGPYRRFPVLFGYSIVLLLTTVVDATAYFNGPAFRQRFLEYYWIDEVIIQTCLFVLVLSFISQALAEDRRRGAIVRALSAVAILVCTVSAWASYDPMSRLSSWMTEISRNLAFTAALFNLVLWMVLMRTRRASLQLLMISGGLGVQSAGEAIAHSVRPLLGPATLWIADLFLILTHFACLWTWLYALRRVGFHFIGVIPPDANRPG